MTQEEKDLFLKELAAVNAKAVELKNLIRDSLPIRSVGGGHVHNELIVFSDVLTRLETQAQAIVVTP